VPDQEFRIVSLGKDSKLNDRAVANVEFLGSSEKVTWNQEAGALVVAKPATVPNKEAVGLKITLK